MSSQRISCNPVHTEYTLRTSHPQLVRGKSRGYTFRELYQNLLFAWERRRARLSSGGGTMKRRAFVRTVGGIAGLTALGVGTATAHSPAGAPSDDEAETHEACSQMPDDKEAEVCAGKGDQPPENKPNEE